MLDLLRPMSERDVNRMIARHTPSRIHTLDSKGKVVVERNVAGMREPDKRPPAKDRLRRALDRQQEILEAVKAHARDGMMTVEQIAYRIGYPSRELMCADLQALHERGVLSRQKITNRDRKRVWSYWVAK